MKLTVEVELTDRQSKTLCQNSLLRVFNLGIKVAEVSEDVDAGTFIEDAEELKMIADAIWAATREAIFKEQVRERAERANDTRHKPRD